MRPTGLLRWLLITLAMCALMTSPTLAQNDNGEAEALRRIQ
jgi:hypothetical protein